MEGHLVCFSKIVPGSLVLAASSILILGTLLT
jgi:septum formation inhibitor MinC